MGRGETDNEVIEKIRDKSDPARFTITFDYYAKLILREKGSCTDFAQYPMKDISLSFSAPWFFSSGISHAQRLLSTNEYLRLNLKVE